MTSGDSTDAAWRPPATDGVAAAEEVHGYADLVEIGRGGDSIVYRARELALHREVAIKVLLVDDGERAARFAREVEITVDLGRQHPNIVTLLAVATTRSGRPAIVMDHHEGGTLHDRLRSHGPMPAEEVVRVGEVLADALDFAHRRGVLHRDVKPQNVLVLPTSWVLADFGIARLADSEHTASADTFTYRHAAPQVLDGYPPTAADDIWSLGSTLYTLLDGRPPFASDDPHEDSALAYLRRARTEPHRPLTTPGSERLAPVIDRCLAKEVGDRWASAGDLRDAFSRLRGSSWEPRGAAAGPPGALEAAPLSPLPPAAPDPEPDPTGARSDASVGDAVDVTAVRPPAHRWADVGAAPEPVAEPVEPPVEPVAQPVRPAVPPLVQPTVPPAVPPQAAPTYVEPAPVALSLAGRAPAPVDAEATGLRSATGPLPGRPGPPALGDGKDDDEPRRRMPWLLLGVAVVVSIILGVGGAALRRGDDDRGTSTEVTDGPVDPVPALTTDPGAVPTVRDTPDPALAFVITDIRSRPDGLYLAWKPVDDEDVQAYSVVETLPEEKPVGNLPATSREYTLPIEVPAGRSCYRMVVFTVQGSYGVADERCVKR